MIDFERVVFICTLRIGSVVQMNMAIRQRQIVYLAVAGQMPFTMLV